MAVRPQAEEGPDVPGHHFHGVERPLFERRQAGIGPDAWDRR